jgi:uncharacterized iron-regulated membrane protein
MRECGSWMLLGVLIFAAPVSGEDQPQNAASKHDAPPPSADQAREPEAQPTAQRATRAPESGAAQSPAEEEAAKHGISPLAYAKLTKGYTRAMRGNTAFYCRKEMPHGSRVPRRVCWSLEDLILQQRVMEEQRPALSRKQLVKPPDNPVGARQPGL